MLRAIGFVRSLGSTDIQCVPIYIRSSCQFRQYSSKGFFQSLIDKVKEESSRDLELKENIRKFREETAKLEQSKELKAVRDFYKKLEKELPTDSVDRMKGTIQNVASKIREDAQQFANKEAVKKGLDGLSKASEQVKDVTRSIGEAKVLQSALKSVEALDKELHSDRARIYEPPKVLKTRNEVFGKIDERVIKPDDESSGIVLHKDSKWYAAWQDFKENNHYAQKFFDIKAQYQESDNLVVRSIRYLTDRVSQAYNGLGSNNELQVVLDEITKMDPSFDIESFIRYCRFIVIPNVLESIMQGDLRILKDWCHEAPYNVLATPLNQIKHMGYTSDSRVLDVHNVDIQMGKMMEQGPVLIVTFQAQQINCIRDSKGAIHEGDPEKVMRVTHIWALCRDQSETNPWSAWRLLDIAMMPSEQWL